MSTHYFANYAQVGQLFLAALGFMVTLSTFVRSLKRDGVSWWRRPMALPASCGILICIAFVAHTEAPDWAAQSLEALACASGGATAYSFLTLRRGQLRGTGPTEIAPIASSLKVLEITVENADHIPSVEYKRKLRVVLQNREAEEIIVGPNAFWQARSLRVRYIPQLVWELEPNDGWHSDKWTHREVCELRVPPGRAFRTWIGLHKDATEAEVSSLRDANLSGDLIVPIRVVGTSRQECLTL